MIAACSGSSGDPLVEYPPASADPGTDPSADGSTTPGTDEDGGAPDARSDAPEPIVGKKLLATSVFLEGRTSDGHLVFFDGPDLKVWPDGASAPVTIQKDFEHGYDSMVVRGRFVATWLGENVATPPLAYWAKSSGIVNIPGDSYRDALYPRASADDFAYLTKGSSSLRRNVKVTKAGSGAGTTVVSNLDLGYPNDACRMTITFVGDELLVAGCPNGGSIPKVSVHSLDGTASRTLLDSSAPGMWVNSARTKVLVQTASASSIRPLSGLGANVALDGPILQAAFSKDDAKVVYRDTTKKVKRASTTAPASPVELASGALDILDVSSDLRFVVYATKGDPSKSDSDLVVADANTPGTSKVIAPDKAVSFGISTDGTKLVYLAPRELSLRGPLYVVTLPNGTPQKISDVAERVLFTGDVIYFQELVKATKTSTLKAVKLTDVGKTITIDQNLDSLTAHIQVVGKKLFVASKLGLWEYPAQ